MSSLLLALLATLGDGTALFGYFKQNAFPQPLSKEKEKEMIEKTIAGDDTARKTLIEHNLRLVAHIVKKFENTGESNEDLISIGTIGLIKAIESYSFDKGTKLATYAARCIENEILMFLRSLKKVKKDVSLNDPIGEDKDGNAISLIDVLRGEEDELDDLIQNKMNQRKVREYLQSLDERERDVIIKRFGLNGEEEKTQREIAKELGISRSYVSRIEKRALMKLFHEFSQQERKGNG
ncbi:RNA polymerase sporulation sigma factor SigK [Jeotgalibacillus soli]|uniref:RNA polymerase sigma factor n=1 Tax=Jeotgalibacillus soli TaxID=889306 RepID=A0A0C2RRW3_9BACL|nr:RNA polymerase sporulation sigma factor SigK [Jeotgalibacillus soli]KIL44484.1 RNA polymerase sigma 70 [Jeotgalibacillus soli]